MSLLKDRWRFDRRAHSPFHSHQAAAPTERTSNGLEQFVASLQGQSNLMVLDLGGASQANISFITGLGHRLYSEDLLDALDKVFEPGNDFYSNQSDPQRVQQFIDQSLDFPVNSLNGVLVWDSLQLLSPNLLHLVVERLYQILQPGAAMLAFFNSSERAQTVPLHSYRINGPRSLLLTTRGERPAAQFFNNRTLERLFHSYASIKFFLTRDNLREIIITR